MGPVSAWFPDGRLHLQDGPIDLIIQAWGAPAEVERAYALARGRFQHILEELVSELALLRAPVAEPYPLARGPVARRMVAAVWPHRAVFVTPMAAVAGAVADEILAALISESSLKKAYVNDGGDIAVYLARGETLSTGIIDNPLVPAIRAAIRIDASCGIATSGWRGRSQSLGIADAVTVIARDAAGADAAATLIANAVNVAHSAIRRLPAREVKLDSDLCDLPVTVEVGEMPKELKLQALDNGLRSARAMQRGGLIQAAYLAVQGETAISHEPAIRLRLQSS
jgi:hypothetical protein